jgi:hypothetical protein
MMGSFTVWEVVVLALIGLPALLFWLLRWLWRRYSRETGARLQ